jgi:predicted heme/steroid binding protein
MQKFFTKIDRISAWTLFIGILLYLISGYGMTKGIISASLASKIHLDHLAYIVIIAFVIHTYYAIHSAFKRWCIWNVFTAIILALFYLLFVSGFIYVDRFYVTPKANLETSNKQSNVVADKKESSVSKIVDNSQTQMTDQASNNTVVKTLTLAELAKFNGANGQPAYVAVDGQVYDLSGIFKEGKHFSHYAGTELTNAFYTRHAKSALEKYPIVGTLSK